VPIEFIELSEAKLLGIESGFAGGEEAGGERKQLGLGECCSFGARENLQRRDAEAVLEPRHGDRTEIS
jgi:hypothetical protein